MDKALEAAAAAVETALIEQSFWAGTGDEPDMMTLDGSRFIPADIAQAAIRAHEQALGREQWAHGNADVERGIHRLLDSVKASGDYEALRDWDSIRGKSWIRPLPDMEAEG